MKCIIEIYCPRCFNKFGHDCSFGKGKDSKKGLFPSFSLYAAPPKVLKKLFEDLREDRVKCPACRCVVWVSLHTTEKKNLKEI